MILKTGVMAAENSSQEGIHYISNCIKIENGYLKIIIFHNNTIFGNTLQYDVIY